MEPTRAIDPHGAEPTQGMPIQSLPEDRTDPGVGPQVFHLDALRDARTPVPTPEPSAHHTQPMLMAASAVQNLEPASNVGATQHMPLAFTPPTLEPPPSPRVPFAPPSPPQRTMGWMIGILVGSALVAAALLVALRPEWFGIARAVPHLEPKANDVPPDLEPYVARAKAGDTQAMRMLGTLYYYGLGVQADRAEARRWFVKASEAGDKAAQRELERLEGRSR